MADFQSKIYLHDPAATDALGRALAAALHPGDTLLLEGDIGAGKTHIARTIIQSILARAGLFEDVPSPTFTLVQTYNAGDVEIWHTDLYRLAGPEDVEELGLSEAFASSICLVEWPDRLGPLAPPEALTVSLTPSGEGRVAELKGGKSWENRLDLSHLSGVHHE